ncbi:hypothetical protein DFH09DRAFT_222886 [Mycena vulgaris]|nr:hypothetical protein DFH09DRAFT_222886 [Mycena vulgaris]
MYLPSASSHGSSATVLPSHSVASSKNYYDGPERGRSLSRSSSSFSSSSSGILVLSPSPPNLPTSAQLPEPSNLSGANFYDFAIEGRRYYPNYTNGFPMDEQLSSPGVQLSNQPSPAQPPTHVRMNPEFRPVSVAASIGVVGTAHEPSKRNDKNLLHQATSQGGQGGYDPWGVFGRTRQPTQPDEGLFGPRSPQDNLHELESTGTPPIVP